MNTVKGFRHTLSDEDLPFADSSAGKALRWLPLWLGSALLTFASLLLIGLASSLALRSVASLNALASLVALFLSWGVWRRVRDIERALSEDRQDSTLGRSESSVRKPAIVSGWRNDEIDALYKDIRKLQEQDLDPGKSRQLESKLARLRELQKEEAAAMRERFEASFEQPVGEALSAIHEAKRFLGRDEDPATASSPSLQQD